MVWPHSAAVIAHTHTSASTARYSRSLFRRFDGDVDTCRTGVAEDICQSFLNDAVDRQIGRLSGLAERWRNRRFNGHIGMRLTP